MKLSIYGFFVTVVLSLTPLFTYAGNLDSPAPPGSTTAYGLDDLYNRLDSGAPGTQATYAEPPGTPAATGNTLNDIISIAPAEDANAATPGDVATGKTFWGLSAGAWGPQTGSRFTDNGDGTVTDNKTGLLWLKNANCGGAVWWQTALNYVTEMNTSGTMNGNDCGDTSNSGTHQTDWRLPNIKELQSLTDFSRFNPALPPGHPFDNVQAGSYWSGTSGVNVFDRNGAYTVDMETGESGMTFKMIGGTQPHTWTVRGGL